MFCSCYDHQTEEDTRSLRYRLFGYLSAFVLRAAFAAVAQNASLAWQWARISTSPVGRSLSLFSRLGSYAFVTRGRTNLSVSGSGQAYRAISTGQLSVLPRLHLRPIDVVVYHGPQGDLVLRGASRLDAFSGYPVRS